MGFQSGIKEEKSLKMLWNNFKVGICHVFKNPYANGRLEQGEYEIYILFFSFLSAW